VSLLKQGRKRIKFNTKESTKKLKGNLNEIRGPKFRGITAGAKNEEKESEASQIQKHELRMEIR
jgi:hypothetical protein